MADAFICEGPNHEGSRLITDPWDRFEGRRELRRIRDRHTETIAKEFNLCKSCGLAWIEEIRPKAYQTGLFAAPPLPPAPPIPPSSSGARGADRVREVLAQKEKEAS